MKLKTSLALATLAAAGTLASGAAQAQACTIKIARIVPVTGPLADVGKDTPWGR